MRICFVPCCDQTRLSAKCMMFMPPKTPEMFERWHSVLPKHRNFKPTDRVCERHFQPGDIQTTWDHIINGKLVQLERNKPMLMPNAVPTLNLQLGAPRGVARSANNSNRRTRDGVAMKRVSSVSGIGSHLLGTVYKSELPPKNIGSPINHLPTCYRRNRRRRLTSMHNIP